MTEEERLERLAKKKELESRKQDLLKKKKALQNLENNFYVKSYLKLKRELELSKFVNDEDIFTLSTITCKHDIYFYMGAFKKTKSKLNIDKRSNSENADYFLYYCLDCCSPIKVKSEFNEEFIKNNKIIKIAKNNITSDDFKHYQNVYFDCLLKTSSDKAYIKTLEKLN